MTTEQPSRSAAIWATPLLALLIGLSAGPDWSARAQQGQGAGRGTAAAPSAAPAPQTRPDNRRSQCQEQTPNAFCYWWKDPAVKKEIGLSDEKTRRIDNMYQQRVRNEQPFSDELDKERGVLNQMAKERKASVGVYSVQAAKVSNLQAKLWETRNIMLYRMFLELTPDQITKLEALQERTRTGRGNNSSK